jgi:hypothetical protein
MTNHVHQLAVFAALMTMSLLSLRPQDQVPHTQDSVSATVRADPSVKAGDPITFHIELDRPANIPRAYVSVYCTGPENKGASGGVELEPEKLSYDIPVTIPFDAPGGTWHLTQVTVGTVTGMHSSQLTFDRLSFQVIQEGKFDLPTAAKVSINLSQSQLLHREAANLQHRIQELKAAISALPEGKRDARISAILRENVLEADKALEKTEADFLKLVSTQSQKPAASIFFGDLHVTYQQALARLKLSSSLSSPNSGPRIQTVRNDKQYPLLAEAILPAFEQNELAYKVVADTGSLTFDLEVNTAPEGADVSYRRRGDSFEKLQNKTNSSIKALTYAIWFVRFEKTGFRTEEREHDPFHEQNHVINVELQPEKKKLAQ